MCLMGRALLFSLSLGACFLVAAEYDGPRPPKTDIPYLVHANHLVATEVAEARESGGKKETTYMIPGAASSAKTPLAEPVFILEAKDLAPDQLDLYRLEVKNGQREVVMVQKRRHSPAGPFHLIVDRLGGKLYKIEVDEPLEPGQYSLSPNGSNRVFCFEIY